MRIFKELIKSVFLKELNLRFFENLSLGILLLNNRKFIIDRRLYLV